MKMIAFTTTIFSPYEIILLKTIKNNYWQYKV
jgi:hypothetical protein